MNSISQRPKITVRRATFVEYIIHRTKREWSDFLDMSFEESLWILIGGAIFTFGTLGVFWLVFRLGWFVGIVGVITLWFVYMIAKEHFFAALNRQAENNFLKGKQ